MKLTLIQQKELDEAVKKRKEIPIKFCYAGMAWHKIATDPEHVTEKKQLHILKKSVKLTASKVDKPINILHLGIGDGIEIPHVIDAIGFRNIKIYTIVDINPSMLKLSKSFALKKYPKLNIKTYCRNIETKGIRDIAEELKRKGVKRNLILLTGNGVLFSNPQTVKFIREAIKPEDYFFLTLELFKKGKQKEIFDSYMVSTVLDLLSIGIKRAGFKSNYENFSIKFDKKTSRLKMFYKAKKEKLFVLASYKPTNVQKIEKRLKKYGFKKEFLIKDKNIHSCGGLFKI